MFFSNDPCGSFRFHESEHDASQAFLANLAAANEALADSSSDGSESAICWGEVYEHVTISDRPLNDEEKEANPDWDYIRALDIADERTARVLTCVYCGQEYPQGTPASGHEVLTEHIKVCEKHPMRKLQLERDMLRRALVGLVGADTLEELNAMEAAIRVLPVASQDRISALNVLHALKETITG